MFNFYEETTEDQLTKEWLVINDEVNDFLTKVSDRDFRNQMIMEGKISVDKDLKMKLLKYFNKIDRLAGQANLLVGKEDKGATEPKKGLVGFRGR